MILVANFNMIETSLLQKVAEELGIDGNCRYLDDAVSTRDELVAALKDESGKLPRVVIVNLDSDDADWEKLVGDLKAHEIWRYVPIMGFGFLEDPEIASRFYALGGASCIRKPDGYEGLKEITEASIRYWLDVSYMPCDFLTDVA